MQTAKRAHVLIICFLHMFAKFTLTLTNYALAKKMRLQFVVHRLSEQTLH